MESIEEIHKLIGEVDPLLDKEDPTYKAMVSLVSSAIVGASVKRVSKFTRYPRSLIYTFSKNLTESGVWKNGKVYCGGWDDERGGDIAFIMDAMVAVGIIKRVVESKESVKTQADIAQPQT